MASSEDDAVDSSRSWPDSCRPSDEKQAKRQREDEGDDEILVSSSKRKKPTSMPMIFSLPGKSQITSSRSLFAPAQPGIDLSAASKDSSASTFKLLHHLDRACGQPSPDEDQGADVPEEKGPQAGGDLVGSKEAKRDEAKDKVSWSLDDLVSDEHTSVTPPSVESSTTANAQGLGLKFGLPQDSGPSLFGGAEQPGITLQQVSRGSLVAGKFSLEHARFNPPTESAVSKTKSDAIACSSPSGEIENSDKAAPVESAPRSDSQPADVRLSPTHFHHSSVARTPSPTVLSASPPPQPQAKDKAFPSSPSQMTGRNPFLSSLSVRARSKSPPTRTAVSAPPPVQTGVLKDRSEGSVAKSKPVAHFSSEGEIKHVTTAALVESSTRAESRLRDGRHSPIHSHHGSTTKTSSIHSVGKRQQRPNSRSKADSPKSSQMTDSNPFPSRTVQIRSKSPLIVERPTSPAQSDVSESQLKPPYASNTGTRPSLPGVLRHDPLTCDKPQSKVSSEHMRENSPTLPAPATAVTLPPSQLLPCQNLPPQIELALVNQLTESYMGSGTVSVPPLLPASQTTIHRRINFSFLAAFSDLEVVSRICEINQISGVSISIFTYKRGMISLDEFAGDVKEFFRECTSQNKLPTIRHFYQQLSGARPSVEWEFCDTMSDAAQWRPLSGAVNTYLCHQCCEGRATFELPGPEESYLVDLSRMTITGALTERTGYLRSLKPTWSFFQDDEFGFVPFNASVSHEIEDVMLFGSATHLTIDDSHCTIDFDKSGEKPLLLYIADESKEICRLERNPPLSSPVIHEFKVQFCGNVDTITMERTIEAVKIELKNQINEKDIDVSSIQPTFRCLLYQMARQYCIEVTMSSLETIHLQGTDHLYLDKVSLQLERTCLHLQRQTLECAALYTHIPPNWEPQKEDEVMVSVRKESSEWEHVHNLMKKTIPSVQLLKLERVQNADLWGRFHFFRSRMKASKEDLNEKDLFHGTRAVVPTDIINDKRGFDFRCARDGMWGAGIYFAVKASYSDKNYAYKVPGESCKQLFLARVLTGKSKDLAPDRTLRKPPAGYDTVTGTTNGSRVYVVYDHEKAYPAYLITYTS